MFNPPNRVTNFEITEGTKARGEFAEHYGSHIEIVYAICKGDFLKMQDVMGWDTEKYLFIGEYLIRKRDVENIK